MNFKGISQRAMDELGAANRLFLSLLRAHLVRGNRASRFGLDRRCGQLILHLDDAGLEHVANCPFALFSLDFQNHTTWHSMLERRVGESVLVDWSAEESGLNQFLLMAMTAIRYLSGCETYAASMLYGMSPDLSRRLAAVDLAMLPTIAGEVRTRLSVTLNESPAFWRDLLMLSQGPSERGATAVRTLGLQLTIQRALGLTGCHVEGQRLLRSS